PPSPARHYPRTACAEPADERHGRNPSSVERQSESIDAPSIRIRPIRAKPSLHIAAKLSEFETAAQKFTHRSAQNRGFHG
ncbi:MAG: hypothetical protein CUN54_10385, partial [Phototrophicales bacterium]